MRVDFSSRKGDISVYGLGSSPRHEELLARLGKHTGGKGCLYLKKLSDIDPKVWEELVASAAEERMRRNK